MGKVKYTFLLAAFKTHYLKETITSILGQKYKDFLLVVSDDCSPEDVKGVVNQFDDKRLLYVRNDINIGGYKLVGHWNLQLKRDAQSDYVIMASDDDVYDNNFLIEIDKLVEKYPEVDEIRARCRIIGGTGELISVDDPADEYQTELQFSENLYNGRHIRSFANFVFKTEVLKNKGGFVNFPYAWYADAATTLMMAEHGVANTSHPLFSYRSSPLAISSTRNKQVIKGKMEATLMYYEWMDFYIRNMKFTKNVYNSGLMTSFIHLYRHDAFATIISYFSAHSLIEIIKIIRKLKTSEFFTYPSFGKELLLFYLGKFA